MKPFDEELVSGSIVHSVWKLSWPIVLMNLINGIHGLVDQVLVGHYVAHHEANAAIGVAWNLFLLVVVSLASLFHGMGVLIAQYAGRQDRESIEHVLYHTLLSTFYLVIFVMAPLGYLLSPSLLSLVRATPEVQEYALPYLRIMFLFGAPLSFNFLMGTAMQSSGDPKTPLKLAILSTILNVIISAILITGVGPFPAMGPSGAALGTCLAPIPGLMIAYILIRRGKLILQLPDKWPLIPDPAVIRSVTRIGIPTGINGVVLNIGGIWLYRFIGTLESGSAAMAAYTVCYAQLFSFVTWASLGLRGASATLMGQNIGAGKTERGKRGVHVAAAMGVSWACAWGLAAWSVPEVFLGIFNLDDPHVVTFGSALLRYLAFSGVFLSAALAFTGGLIGAGDTQKPMWIAIVTQIFVLLGVCQIYAWLGMLTASAIWQAILISHFSRYLLTHIVFRRAKWKPIVLDIRGSQRA
ncbi:MAG: MATE family efflux transporter [Candidatus Hydrogenedentes bacterium]|nr:MATE family efflux transporter [Candidatus Hydrogenedentota bacterium]